jgi:tripartite-type tricarboxylate transporter receptor subunit TctC
MVNFIDSFNKGISAAERAIANKDEIDSVIEQLSEQLQQVTNGKLKISIIKKQAPLSGLAITELMNRKTYWAIAASNPLSSFQPKELAQWTFSENGYPCKITLTDTEIYCEDRTALENALAKMIATPEAGKKMKSVMEQNPVE